MFKSVLIANRGEIAVRIARTLRKLGIRSIGIYSEVDRNCGHVNEVDYAIELKGDTPGEIYLRIDLIINIALSENVEAIIPGYGFLSENVQFAIECEKVGICFIGPTSEQIHQFGHKHIAYELASQANLPLLPHTGLLENIDDAKIQAKSIGYPIMLKSTAGSGGNGICKCLNEVQLIESFEKVCSIGDKFYKNRDVYMERYIDNGRHIEVQIFGDGLGHVIALGERDCSLQRRNQKIIEETPPPLINDFIRNKIRQSAIQLGLLVKYKSVGTVEFIYDKNTQEYYFLEVNCRLQVEHPVTELIYNIDLVEWMIKLANGYRIDHLYTNLESKGVSIEVRICSEEPLRDFRPSTGLIHEVLFPSNVRIDTWISNGIEITPYYDSLLAKIIVHGHDRDDAIKQMNNALEQIRLIGINTNLDFLRNVISSKEYLNGNNLSLQFLTNLFQYEPNVIEILEGGTYTTIQDYPGRINYWDIGVPPSGPMDHYAFRLGNRLVGNNENAAGIECTLIGPTIKFNKSTIITITGGQMNAKLDNKSIDLWQRIFVKNGQILKLDKATSGCRTYICIYGGIDVPIYLGSRSTFVLGQFGGYAGRILKSGDILFLDNCISSNEIFDKISNDLIPYYPNQENDNEEWQIGVLYGPHGAPEFFTEDFIEKFFLTTWKVHYNSNRLGVRLLGPKPDWSRIDGGEAGLHPSNIHDCQYAIGSINFTGDTPIILTQDGPSLGGFVCPVTIIKSELWKIGQLKPNDRIRFYPMTFDQALKSEIEQDKSISTLIPSSSSFISEYSTIKSCNCILYQLNSTLTRPSVIYRQAGDNYILIEYGSQNFDLTYRFRVHFLIEELRYKNPIEGILELSPGVRSLQIRYSSQIIHQKQLLAALLNAEEHLPNDDKKIRVKSRIIYLPLTFEDSSTLDAVQRYKETVKSSAPWLPNNIDFIQRINGLESRDDVKQIIFNASYLILGLGDVYLGAPCALPIDPRHRLVTSKYNPARTFTAEGTVGIGGVYMCIYGMDSPGGYQLIGRTLPIWNTFNKNTDFKDGNPWLLRFFDQVRFYPVDEKQLLIEREQFRQGNFHIKIIEENIFDLGQFKEFLQENLQSINEFTIKQTQAFDKEVSHWQNDEQNNNNNDLSLDNHLQLQDDDDNDLTNVYSDICGSVWKILVQIDQIVEIDTPIIILEAMKMEIIIRSPIHGQIHSILCQLGQLISIKDILFKIKPC